MKDNKELLDLASRVNWFEDSKDVVKNKYKFLNHIMVYGTLDDVKIMLKYYSLHDCKEALQNTQVGLYDYKSWHFWHIALGYDDVLPLPKRAFLNNFDDHNIDDYWYK
jgi:hypothetical protein